jgi:uncharacterized protein YndB with AHSA1/START domain
MPTTDTTLARFVDRHTMVYDRRYPHPIERVWEAVTTSEHLDVWLLPESRVEARLGGACAFGWGGSADDPAASTGEVTVFDPPSAVQYTYTDGSFMRFELAPDGDGTRLAFTLHFMPSTNGPEDYPGGDLPAGNDTAWRPGFLSGFHQMLGELDRYLRGEWTAEDRARNLEGHIAGTPDPEYLRLIEEYRAHIREHCPPA